VPTPEVAAYYRRREKDRVDLIIAEGTAVDRAQFRQQEERDSRRGAATAPGPRGGTFSFSDAAGRQIA